VTNSHGTRPPAGRKPSKGLPFSQDCKQVLQQLRGALTGALNGLDLDPSRPQELSRSLGLHRNLAWKVSKIIKGTDVFASVPHIPGRVGMEIVVRALAAAGARAEELARLRTAMEDFERVVSVHAGDRGTLELVAGGLVPGAPQRDAMHQARRLAFRGNSAIWGVQVRMNLSLSILAPNADDPRRVDLAQINGLVDFCALRSDVVWPLFRRAVWGDGRPAHAVDGEPIAPVRSTDDVPLLSEFCSPDLPELEVVHGEQETTFWLPARKVGRTGELTCIHAILIRGIGSQYAQGQDRLCELETSLITPVELLQADLLAHESMTWAHSPRADVYSLLEQRAERAPGSPGRMRLPIDEQAHELGLGLETMATSHVPGYRRMLAYVFEQLGWEPTEFRGFRYELGYPPVPSRVALTMDLWPESAD
jgi:hypothetical protein